MLTNLADVLRNAGLKVVEVPGWKTRGHGPMSGVRGVLWHHTATSAKVSGDYPSERVVLEGNGTTDGPLCNLGLGRSGTWYVISAGLAYHAGTGSHPAVGTNGNGYLIGIEAEHPGTAGNPWPAEQLDSYRRGTAALLKAYGLGADRLIGHKEWAPARKIDPYGLDMKTERAHVENYLRGSPAPGGIESMALDTPWKDTYGNTQTVQGFMAETQRDLNEIHAALLALQKSRIPGDPNMTNGANALMDTVARASITYAMVQDLHRKVDELETGG
ncbi:N-acetylmuramoyl-L-alanine amidase, partial [Saccharopolyspora kobensis]